MPKVTISVGERILEVEINDLESLRLAADAIEDKSRRLTRVAQKSTPLIGAIGLERRNELNKLVEVLNEAGKQDHQSQTESSK